MHFFNQKLKYLTIYDKIDHDQIKLWYHIEII